MGRDPFADALRYLVRAPHSREEMGRYLERKGVAVEEREAWLDRMSAIGYLNDGLLGRQEVGRLAPRFGVQVIRQRLRARGLTLPVEDGRQLAEDEEHRAFQLLAAWELRESSRPGWRDRLAARLLRRGFSRSAVVRAFNRLQESRPGNDSVAEEDGPYVDRPY